MGAKFAVGQSVRIERLLNPNPVATRDLLGRVERVTEIDPLPNGEYNYTLEGGYYIHEAELEPVDTVESAERCACCGIQVLRDPKFVAGGLCGSCRGDDLGRGLATVLLRQHVRANCPASGEIAASAPAESKRERMDSYFSVFNGHINSADSRADAEFKAQFGAEVFEREIAPCHREGIMSIFHGKPSLHTFAWVTLVTAYVNENASAPEAKAETKAAAEAAAGQPE